jgi:hypothetical protein
MHKPPSRPDRDDDEEEGDEDDTAFGGLAPRAGPGTGPDADPAGPGRPRRGSARWIALAGLVVALLLAWMTFHGAR